MNLDFEKILFYATLVCGIIYLVDVLLFAKKRGSLKPVWVIDYARSFFPILLIVFFLRSFLFEPFRIPSGSLEPTLLVGDFIIVNKYDYGLRLPILRKQLFAVGEPKHGDIMVFRYPVDPSMYFIKRVIGVPGDHISYIDKIVYVNGQKASQQFVKDTTDTDEEGAVLSVVQKEENLLGVKHDIFQDPQKPNDDFKDVIVPPGMYFMMGDNRDASADSRYWGFVPENNIVGKASLIWMNWDASAKFPNKIRWNRIGTVIR